MRIYGKRFIELSSKFLLTISQKRIFLIEIFFFYSYMSFENPENEYELQAKVICSDL